MGDSNRLFLIREDVVPRMQTSISDHLRTSRHPGDKISRKTSRGAKATLLEQSYTLSPMRNLEGA